MSPMIPPWYVRRPSHNKETPDDAGIDRWQVWKPPKYNIGQPTYHIKIIAMRGATKHTKHMTRFGDFQMGLASNAV